MGYTFLLICYLCSFREEDKVNNLHKGIAELKDGIATKSMMRRGWLSYRFEGFGNFRIWIMMK